MKKLNTFLFCSLSLIVMAACSKDNDDDTNPVNPSSNLNAIEKKLIGNWAVDGIYRAKPKSTTDTTSTYTDIIEACEKDNVYTFKASRKYSLNEGSNICTYNQNASGPSWEAEWKVGVDSNFTFADASYGQFNSRIVELTDTKLVTSVTIPSTFPPYSSEVHVFKRK